MFVNIKACKHDYGVKENIVFKSLHAFFCKKTFSLSSPWCLNWTKFERLSNIDSFGFEQKFAVWFERGILKSCFERFVTENLNDIAMVLLPAIYWAPFLVSLVINMGGEFMSLKELRRNAMFLIELPKCVILSCTSVAKSRLWVNSQVEKYVFVGSSEK